MTSNADLNPESIPPQRAAPTSEYPLLESPQAMQNMLRLIAENLGRQKFDILSLPRIKVLKDGIFQVETAAGMEPAKALNSVITAYRQSRIYWGKPYSGASKEPPSCTSTDGFIGVGDPGGACEKCPFKEFNTARNPDGSLGAGQACKELRQMLVLLPGQMMPHRLDVPPTSLKNFNKYAFTLVSAGVLYWEAVTRLGLEMGSSSSGMSVARVTFALAKRLTADQSRIISPYHEKMAGYLAPMTVDADAYEITEGAPGPNNPDDVPF